MLSAAVRSLAPLWRGMALAWWRWALADLSRKDPCHEDVPVLVHRIRQLESPAPAVSLFRS